MATPGTRDPSQIPFASDSVFNLPLGLNAQWMYNAQLAGANVGINTVGNWNENIWTGTASDPVVTVTNTAASGGTAGTFQVHIPVGAVPAGGTDQTFSVDDTATHTWYSFGGFNWTSATTATVMQGSGESDFGSGIQVAGSSWDEGVGTLRESDLQAGAINHMLRFELPVDMLESYSKTSTTVLAPYAWPQQAEDGFAISGGGIGAYTGTIPFGVTIGIPANAVEPADVKANAGANMLWNALQDHGAMLRDSAGAPNTAIFQADQDVNPNDPLILGMDQYGAEIMAQTEILANQGPNSVNGGGTPIVPLDPPPSDAPGGTTPPPTTGPTTPPPSTATSTVLTPTSGGSLTDAQGNVWTLTSGGIIDENGQAVPDGSDTASLTYVASTSTIWGQDAASKLWYQWTGSGWTGATTTSPVSAAGSGSGGSPTPPPPPSPPPAPPPTATPTVLTPTSGGSITDGQGNTWTLTSGGIIDENGQAVPDGSDTTSLTYVASTSTIWGQDAASKLWYQWTGSGWTGATTTSPVPPTGTGSGGSNPVPTPTTSITVQAANQPVVSINTSKVGSQTVDGATVNLTAPGAAKVMLGSTAVTMKFAHMSSINLTEGSANATVTSDAGINTFTAGAGKLIVTGGSGADAYIFHKGDGTMTVNDFSLAKGDALTIDLSLKGAAKFASDGHGGTMISFGTATSGRIDLVGAAGVKAGNVHFA